MDFRRINEKTVRCVVSEEEMKEYGLEIEDFFTDREKSREFLESIVEQAHEKVGYETDGGMISMQLMRLPNKDLAITFTEGSNNVSDMLNYIKNIAGLVDETNSEGVLDAIRNMDDKEKLDAIQKMLEDYYAENPEKDQGGTDFVIGSKENLDDNTKVRQKKTGKKKKVFMVAFHTMDDAERFAKAYPESDKVNSRLYTDGDSYSLIIKKGKLSAGSYRLLCHQVLEYGRLLSVDPYNQKRIEEHDTCIIKKNALKVLKEL